MQTTLSHPRKRETLVRAIPHLVFPFTVRSWWIRRLTRLLSIRSHDDIGCAATPFLQLDNVYPTYSSSLRDSSTRPIPRNTKPVLRAAAIEMGCVSRKSLVTTRLLRSFSSASPSPLLRALLHHGWNCPPHNAAAIKFITWNRTVKRPCFSWRGRHAPPARRFTGYERETVGNCFRFEAFSSWNGGEIYRRAPVDIGL